jgi:hypothetical protein
VNVGNLHDTGRSGRGGSRQFFGDCGHSHLPTDDRDKFAAELLDTKATNWRCRPVAVAVTRAL